MSPTVLILGVTGGIGRAFADACQKRGWHIKALHRDPSSAKSKLSDLSNIEWIAGDAMNRNVLVAAAKGVDIIFHGVNPPGYKKWRKLAIPMLENSIEAAIASNARLAFPGNVYNFGPDAWPIIDETSPQYPKTIKGQVRVEMEQMLTHAASKGAKSLIVRAGDFFGPNASGSWFAQGIIKPGKKLKSVLYPGKHDVGHSWAYLPDLANTFVQLLEKEAELVDFDTFHFQGHFFSNGVEIAEETAKIAGISSTPIKSMPWMIIKLASPFVTMFRELLEMRYLWNEEVKLDNSKLIEFLGDEPHTPTKEALTRTLRSFNCL